MIVAQSEDEDTEDSLETIGLQRDGMIKFNEKRIKNMQRQLSFLIILGFFPGFKINVIVVGCKCKKYLKFMFRGGWVKCMFSMLF